MSISCGHSADEQAPPFPPEKPASAATAPATSAAAPGPTPAELSRTCFLDRIGSVINPAAQKAVHVSEDRDGLGFSGWAVDQPNKTLAGGVTITIDHASYPARYGIERGDVAQYFNNPAYQNAGFQLILPPRKLPKGIHSALVRVLSSDRKTSYQCPPVQFTLE